MTSRDGSEEERPRVVVLMATYNGMPWIDEQVDSLLAQQGVDLLVRVSDDGSGDGTHERLQARADLDTRINVLPRRQGPRGVTANFLHLFTTWAPTTDTFVAFCDQDDVWYPDKLISQIALIRSLEVDAVSSNVMSVDSQGNRRLIVKSQPQVRWDHVFEAAGPGSTYVFTPHMHARLVEQLGRLDTRSIGVHDWFLYALARGIGGRWHIDPRPTLDYRQHGGNVQGEHRGLGAFRSRLEHLRSGFYGEQFLLIADAIRTVGEGHMAPAMLEDLDGLRGIIADRGLRGRAGILGRRGQIRRSRREALELALARVVGFW